MSALLTILHLRLAFCGPNIHFLRDSMTWFPWPQEGGPGLLHSSLSSGAFLTAASHCGSMANLHASGSHAAVHAVPSHSHIVAITGPGGVPDHVAMQRWAVGTPCA